jgi:hypothetical protein
MAFREEILIGSKADTRGFKKAETAATKLTKTVKALGIATSAYAAVDFAKSSVRAFIADEASANKLSLAVKNLGLEFANPYISDYISKLEATSKVADDDLRPAFQNLLTTTGSLTKSQEILNTAIEASRGSGYDLAQTSADLAQAYVGNTKGLKKYYLGLDQAALKAASFTDIQKIMNNQFTGSSVAYLNTYSGQVGVLSLAWGNFQEKVGGTLITLASFGDGTNGTKLNLLAATLDKIGSAIELIGKGKETIAGLFDITGKNGLLSKFNPYPQGGTADAAKPETTLNKYQKLMKKIEDDRKRQNDALIASNKKLTAEQKKQAALKKAGTVFDLEQINLIAALKGKLSADDKLRAEAQLALLNDNDVLATQLTKQILMAQDSTGKLYQYFLTIGDTKIKNPFAFLDDWIIEFQKKMNSLTLPDLSKASTYSGGMDPALAAIGVIAGYGANIPQTGSPSTVASNEVLNGLYGMQSTSGFVSTASATGMDVKVYVSGSVVTEQELVDAIQTGLRSNSLSGSPSQIGRIAGMFG